MQETTQDVLQTASTVVTTIGFRTGSYLIAKIETTLHQQMFQLTIKAILDVGSKLAIK